MMTYRWKKKKANTEKIENVKKIHAIAKEVLQYGVGKFVWAG